MKIVLAIPLLIASCESQTPQLEPNVIRIQRIDHVIDSSNLTLIIVNGDTIQKSKQ